VRVFAANLRDLLLAAPAGQRVTMGLDPGFRTGVKVAVVDATGKVVATTAIYPHEPQRRWDEALATLAKLARDHRVELIAIGNGTASRETDKLVTELVRLQPELKLSKIVVSEAGASVYSASAFASQELPDLDVTVRGAVSIARRLQDPLAELVKIDPKSIGVGPIDRGRAPERRCAHWIMARNRCHDGCAASNKKNEPIAPRPSQRDGSFRGKVVRGRYIRRMSKKLPLTDFRAVRHKIEPHEFAMCEGQDVPPSDLVEPEVWGVPP
jgi:hypothetical protein